MTTAWSEKEYFDLNKIQEKIKKYEKWELETIDLSEYIVQRNIVNNEYKKRIGINNNKKIKINKLNNNLK